MNYIQREPNPSGAYPAPQSNPAPGLVAISTALSAIVYQYNGFVTLTIADNTVQEVAPNIEAYQQWRESQQAMSTPKTQAELIAQLQAQVAALSSQLDFQEECLVEMAGIIYA